MGYIIKIIECGLLFTLLPLCGLIFIHHIRFHYAALFLYKQMALRRDNGEFVYYIMCLIAIEVIALTFAFLNHWVPLVANGWQWWLGAVISPLVLSFVLEILAIAGLVIISWSANTKKAQS